jgi:hypothetical protein
MGLQVAPAPHQPRQQLYRLVPVEQDSMTGVVTNIDPNQPLYQITHPPMQSGVAAAGGLQGFTREQLSRIVVQSPQSGFVVAGGQQHLQQGFSGAAQGAQGNHHHHQQQQQQGVIPLVVGQMPLPLPHGLTRPQPAAVGAYAHQAHQQAYFTTQGHSFFLTSECAQCSALPMALP